MIRHLLIDFDGTLVEESKTQKLAYLLASYQYLKNKIGCLRLLKTALRIQKAMIESNGKYTIASLSESIFKGETNLSSEIYQNMTTYCLKKIPTKSFSDTEDFLNNTKRLGLNLILATNPIFTTKQLTTRLLTHGINPKHFSFITSSDHMHYIKPNSHYYQEILEKLHLNPKECLMIGNDRKKDLPAQKLGIKVILLGQNSAYDRHRQRSLLSLTEVFHHLASKPLIHTEIL